MPEITPEDVLPLDYDLFDYDDPAPTNNKKKNLDQARSPESELEAQRARLFKEGSEFKYTERSDIVGIDNILAEVDDLIHWLQNSKVYEKHNARLEPGAIFEGEPGTGKTLVSRYIASQSGARFVNVRDFPIAGSVVTANDIRDLFCRARESYAATGVPHVLFWDEFETAAVERSGVGVTPEQAATVSQLTAELDGVHGKNEGLVLIGCTNYMYSIDAALRRSGRMGLHIEFHSPDREGKKLLLNHYLRQYNTHGEIDVDTLSYFFDSDANAADIEESCMEAWRFAVHRKIQGRKRLPKLAQPDLIQVFIKRLVGPPTAFVNLPKEDLVRVAIHEAGHAIMALIFDIPLRLVTVQPGKKALGRTIFAEVREHIGTLDEMVSQMRVGIGSIVAERVCAIPPLVGSTGDIKMVNRIATELVDNLYEGDRTKLFHPRAVAAARCGRNGSANPAVSAESIRDSDLDVQDLLEDTFHDALEVMATIGPNTLWDIARELSDRVTLTGDEFREVVERHISPSPISDLKP